VEYNPFGTLHELKNMNQLPVALTIAGSDNSAGAGLQADLKTFSAHGVYGLTAVTCVVAEVPGKVESIQPIDPAVVAAQVRLSFDGFPVAAMKTGMLFSREIMEAVLEVIDGKTIPLVVDPVMVATSGDSLLREDAVAIYKERLFSKATLVTPNLDEVAALLGRPVHDLAAMREAGRQLTAQYGVSFLIKGGHLRDAVATDLLFCDGMVHEFRAPFVEGVSTHGTGCTYSAAVTSQLAKGLSLVEAVGDAKRFVTRAIAHHLRWKKPHGNTDALHHFA